MTDFRDSSFYGYHCDTKHTVAKLHASPHFLDWANQPDPFRHYDGVPLIDLPPPGRPVACEYFGLRDAECSALVSLETVSQLLYYSMALSAWKEVRGSGARWALRVNPSSGNLHPTETHVIARGVAGLEDGCYHFRVDGFQLERRFGGCVDDLLALLDDACLAAPRAVTVVLTSIFAREAWKYRARAFRYCHHDMGHAVQAVVECARGLGLPCSRHHLFDDGAVARALGLAGGDEVPGAVLSIGPLARDLMAATNESRVFQGQANRLVETPIVYGAIDAVYRAACGWGGGSVPHPWKGWGTRTRPVDCSGGERVVLTHDVVSGRDFWDVVRERRSAVDFDGETGISAEALGAILWRAIGCSAGDIYPWTERCGFVRCYVYVHRVSGVEAGVYRYDAGTHELACVREGDQRRVAMELSLGQRIAGDSAFAISMIADFDGAYRSLGERGYRAVHLEAGMIGQGLYLGAESVGVHGTGIGAFFDDDVNEYLGLGEGQEVIYHFTVGGAVLDERLRTLRSYGFEG